MKNKLKSALSFFTTLSNTVKQANKDIDAAKLKLTTEIAAIGVIKTETETTRFYVDYDDLMLSLLKEAAQKMINTCNEYQKRHGTLISPNNFNDSTLDIIISPLCFIVLTNNNSINYSINVINI